jgi:hypothetical protein
MRCFGCAAEGEKKPVRREPKAVLMDDVRRESVSGTGSVRGVERAMSSAADRRERTV